MIAANFAFRVDASSRIGTGHVMRCITLANELREYGAECHFICRAHSGHMIEKIKMEGHQTVLLPRAQNADTENTSQGRKKFTRWLGRPQQDDALETIVYLKNISPKWLVVDHFAIDTAWEQAVKKEIDLKIMVIDGLANRKHDCDLLLDQTFSTQAGSRWKGLVPTACQLFVGPEYALLRPEFVEACKNLQRRSGSIRRILIGFGGVDEPNATVQVIDALEGFTTNDILLEVIVGSDNPHKADILENYSARERINIHVDPDNIAELMASADLAIGAGGTMTWERCMLRLPSLIISIAENQIALAKALDSISAAVYLGDLASISNEKIRNCVNELMLDEQKLFKMQHANAILMPQGDSSLVKFLVKDI